MWKEALYKSRTLSLVKAPDVYILHFYPQT